MTGARIWVSGLVNVETTVPVRRFPVEYYPIDYPFFGVRSAVSGVGLNVAAALRTLGDEVVLASMTGQDFAGRQIRAELQTRGISDALVRPVLRETPASVVLYAPDGRRQVYCDLKDIQEAQLPLDEAELRAQLGRCDLAVVCNINFNRRVLAAAAAAGIPIATDVHVLSDLRDGYNRDFMAAAELLFLSDEGISGPCEDFLLALAREYPNVRVIVLGRGSQGAMLYTRADGQVHTCPAVSNPHVVNTVGAGDALFSAFVHQYAKGRPPLECLAFAQAFASYKIGFDGGAQGFATEAELERWLGRR